MRKEKYIARLAAFLLSAAILVCALVAISADVWLSLVCLMPLLFYALNKLIQQSFKLVHYRRQHRFNRGHVLKFLASLMGVFLVTGSILYIAAFYATSLYPADKSTPDYRWTYSFWEYLMRSIASSVNLFAFNFDSNILDDIRDWPILKGLMAIQTLLSSLCTVAILISLVYARAKAYYDLHYLTHVSDRRNRVYLFFGINEASTLLAKDIRKNVGDRAIIIFVEQVLVNETESDGWSNIIGFFTHRERTFRVAGNIGAKVTLSECKPHDVELENLPKSDDGMYDILPELNLSEMKTLILRLQHISEAQLHLFLLSDNEEENIRDLVTLAKDTTLEKLTKSPVQLRLYCRARRNGINRVMEDVAIQNRRLDVRMVDSSHLAVELLKQNTDSLPVQLVDTSRENPTTVTSEFRSLIIGFDEVGQDVFRFLYEFAAFVDSRSSEDHVMRSPYRCVAIDKSMNTLRGAFESFTPVVRNNPAIQLVEDDCNSASFFESYCNTPLNYVVVANGNEEAGMTLAVRILNYLRIHNVDISKLRIMVRCYTREKIEVLQKIADHYNRGALKAAENLDEAEASRAPKAPIIHLFGRPDEIYTYRMIVDDVLVHQGKIFNESYSRLSGEDDWDKRRKKLLGDGSAAVSLDNLQKLRRQEAQDLANAVHATTKLILLRRALGEDADRKDFIYRYFDASGKPEREGAKTSIRYTYLSEEENRAVKNLAILEHVRWQASHEMLGYLPPSPDLGLHRCDDRLRLHNCMISWEKLDAESLHGWSPDCDYKAYDYLTVDNSLKIHKEEFMNA